MASAFLRKVCLIREIRSFLIPGVQVVGYLGEIAAVEDRALDSLTLLSPVIVKQLEYILAKEHQCDQVAQGDQRHEQVTKVPHELETCYSAKENEGATRENAEDCEHPLLVG